MSFEDYLRAVVERAIREVLGDRLPQQNHGDPLQYLTTDAVASLLGFDEATVRDNMAKGKLPGAKVLGRWRVRRASLERFLVRGVRGASDSGEQRQRVDADAADLTKAMRRGRKGE